MKNMTKRITALLLALMLSFALAACGGGGGSGGNSNRNKDKDPDVDFGAIFAGTYRGGFASLSSSQKRSIVDAGKLAGVDVVFEKDGSVTFTETGGGYTITWLPDGTWDYGADIPDTTTPYIPDPDSSYAPDPDPDPDPIDIGFDIGSVLSGNFGDFNFSALSQAERQALIAEGRAWDVDITFEANGDVWFRWEGGMEVCWRPDGSWKYTDDYGVVVEVSSKWPDNEYSRQVPKPGMPVEIATTSSEEGMYVMFSEATQAEVLAYVDQVRAAGFNIDEDFIDYAVYEMDGLSFSAYNAAGYKAEISFFADFAWLVVAKY